MDRGGQHAARRARDGAEQLEAVCTLRATFGASTSAGVDEVLVVGAGSALQGLFHTLRQYPGVRSSPAPRPSCPSARSETRRAPWTSATTPSPRRCGRRTYGPPSSWQRRAWTWSKSRQQCFFEAEPILEWEATNDDSPSRPSRARRHRRADTHIKGVIEFADMSGVGAMAVRLQRCGRRAA